ncbi:hypothetical protein [Agrobacterium rosae]|uniref:Uncharacterized protein n=1 Tax=Agrobacterium rosae TaxID=1972867 RepID=A0AAW9FDR7_9HYPH|nr:hypothetical protein [Agrobacterium rosae]MDX8302618.1 hypothetical protein [Agrobacterium rosae]
MQKRDNFHPQVVTLSESLGYLLQQWLNRIALNIGQIGIAQ